MRLITLRYTRHSIQKFHMYKDHMAQALTCTLHNCIVRYAYRRQDTQNRPRAAGPDAKAARHPSF